MFHGLCDELPGNVAAWIKKYSKYGWDAEKRGSFPFNVEEWLIEQLDLWLESIRYVDINHFDNSHPFITFIYKQEDPSFDSSLS